MFLTIILAVFVFCLLLLFSELLVKQSVGIAKKFGFSPFIIGFVIVGFGTTLPELLISIFSTIDSHSEIAITNVIGSNVANLCLILGLGAVFKELNFHRKYILNSIPLVLISIISLIIVISINGMVHNWISAIPMVLLFLGYVIYESKINKAHYSTHSRIPINLSIPVLIVSILGVIITGKILVDNLQVITDALSLSDRFVGYVVLSIGSSLPEIVTAFISIKKGAGSFAIGEIFGSNAFNILVILSVSAFIKPINVTNVFVGLISLLIVTILFLFLLIIRKRFILSKFEGFSLLFIYIVFILINAI